jgi:hypothetical protein
MSAVTTKGATMAAKRHHKSMRHPEGMDYAMPKKGMGRQDMYNGIPRGRELNDKGFTEGVDYRRRQEYTDGRMIHEDPSSPSDMPLYSINRMYSMPPQGAAPYLDDSIAGVDNQIRHDVMKMRDHFALRKI